jgi:hypothetical protein
LSGINFRLSWVVSRLYLLSLTTFPCHFFLVLILRQWYSILFTRVIPCHFAYWVRNCWQKKVVLAIWNLLLKLQ